MTRTTNVPAESLRRFEVFGEENFTLVGRVVPKDPVQVAPGGLPTDVLTTVKFAGIEIVMQLMLMSLGSRVTVTLVATPAVRVMGAAATVQGVLASAVAPKASAPAQPSTA